MYYKNQNDSMFKVRCDKSLKKIGMFLDEIVDPACDIENKFSMLGANTGNMLFWHSLKKLLLLEILPRWYVKKPEKINFSQYSAFVTTDLIWIRQQEDFSYLNKLLDAIGDLPLIPISVGLQCNEYLTKFQIHPETVNILRRISERCVMGVRGNYTAEILTHYGITNFMVIGCPSMYINEGKFKDIERKKCKLEKVSMNFETFYYRLSGKKLDFLQYGMDRDVSFVEQTPFDIGEKHIADIELLRQLRNWLVRRRECFFDLTDWRKYMRQMDFSIGMRFHGNVMALWESVPALFITSDSRTKELCEHFSLPTLEIQKFDPTKNIEDYYEMADYSKFEEQYNTRWKEWEEFVYVNSLLDTEGRQKGVCTNAESI